MIADAASGSLGYLLTAVASLSGVIAFLYLRLDKSTREAEKRLQKKLDTCEEQHHKTHEDMLAVMSKIGKLEGRRQGIQELADKVLEVVNELKHE